MFRCDAERTTEPTDLEETVAIRFFGRDEMPALSLPYDVDLLFRPAGMALERAPAALC